MSASTIFQLVPVQYRNILTCYSMITYKNHLKSVSNGVKTIDFLRKFQQSLPRQSLITIYKFFIRPYLDYDNTVYDQAYNDLFHKNVGSIQYNAVIAVTGAITGTPSEKLIILKIKTLVKKIMFLKKNLPRITFS